MTVDVIRRPEAILLREYFKANNTSRNILKTILIVWLIAALR